MPSTITQYYNFAPATKARSSQVNTNFSNYRGDLLPINEDTISSSDMTHNLGGPDHRWLNTYGSVVNLKGSTTTANSIIQPQTSVTTGATEILHGANTAAVFKASATVLVTNNLELASAITTTVFPNFLGSTVLTTGGLDLRFGSSTISSWDASGLKQSSLRPAAATTTAGIGDCALLVVAATTAISSGGTTTIGALRITTKGNGVVRFSMIGLPFTHSVVSLTSTSDWTLQLRYGQTTTSLSTLLSRSYRFTNQATANIFPVEFEYIHTGYPAGELYYALHIITAGLGSHPSGYGSGNLLIKEL